MTLFSLLRCQSRPDISLSATSPNAALKGEREISEEGKGIVKAGQESQTGCSYFGNKKNNAAEYLTRQEGTHRKTGQNRTEISETSRRNRSPRGDGPYPWFGAAAWRPAAASLPSRGGEPHRRAIRWGQWRRRRPAASGGGERARPRLAGSGWKRRAVGPRGGRWGRANEGNF